ncbi:major facilitator superfamily domain-containing protein [Aspergillus welwitschiae]|uniref:Major facilitator superfamily domain-containing protein n=1 Tax=Aspergillus welwitschiae TaxID=1341132 RepID=A0A3F3Q2E0_9EURO|nr:major facilitator superfamily domain-containing protein [Aspergillus welwitschiae]RDH32856.1 major facilitator superfamily domain-containing protein [Aspergillus welwitschiae]
MTVVDPTAQPPPSRPADAEKGKAEHAGGPDPNLVTWEENDPENPHNFSTAYKCWITFQLGLLALSASLGSSIISPAETELKAYLKIGTEVSILPVSLYILGFAFGPLCWAPISELFGRRWSMLPAVFILGLFSIGTATSKNTASVLITRYFAGLFGSAPVSNVSAALGDIFHMKARGIASTSYAICVVGGPTMGPIIGAALVSNPHLGWRWTEYIEAIIVFFIFGITFFCLPEVYGPVLLHRKAVRMRKETGNEELYHPHEHIKVDLHSIVTKHFSRPLVMLVTEPMVTVIALYASFTYALLYLTLEVFPIVFDDIRQWKPVVATLPFIGLFVGVLLSSAFIIFIGQPYYIRKWEEGGGKPVPEARLMPMAVGGFLFAGGLFWFGWTAEPKYSWGLPVVAAMVFGCGFCIIFGQCINFLVDTYGPYAASATASNTFLRSVLAAAFPLFSQPMFRNLGVGPAMSILGGVAAAAIPVPFLFMIYGVRLRKMSRFAPFKG